MFAMMNQVPENAIQMILMQTNEFISSKNAKRSRNAERRENIIDMALIHRKKNEVDRIIESMRKSEEKERQKEKESEQEDQVEWRAPQSIEEARSIAEKFMELNTKPREDHDLGDVDEDWEEFSLTQSDVEEMQE